MKLLRKLATAIALWNHGACFSMLSGAGGGASSSRWVSRGI